jgi:hypothetical protein
MSRVSILKHLVRKAIAAFLFVGLLSVNATAQQSEIFPYLPSASAHLASAAPTPHLPWLAPVGHRQPRRADVPKSESLSAWEREQQRLDQELDHKLIICRRC